MFCVSFLSRNFTWLVDVAFRSVYSQYCFECLFNWNVTGVDDSSVWNWHFPEYAGFRSRNSTFSSQVICRCLNARTIPFWTLPFSEFFITALQQIKWNPNQNINTRLIERMNIFVLLHLILNKNNIQIYRFSQSSFTFTRRLPSRWSASTFCWYSWMCFVILLNVSDIFTYSGMLFNIRESIGTIAKFSANNGFSFQMGRLDEIIPTL